jgi:hypothetical protein
MKYEFHPLANIFPMMSDAEIEAAKSGGIITRRCTAHYSSGRGSGQRSNLRTRNARIRSTAKLRSIGSGTGTGGQRRSNCTASL